MFSKYSLYSVVLQSLIQGVISRAELLATKTPVHRATLVKESSVGHKMFRSVVL